MSALIPTTTTTASSTTGVTSASVAPTEILTALRDISVASHRREVSFSHSSDVKFREMSVTSTPFMMTRIRPLSRPPPPRPLDCRPRPRPRPPRVPPPRVSTAPIRRFCLLDSMLAYREDTVRERVKQAPSKSDRKLLRTIPNGCLNLDIVILDPFQEVSYLLCLPQWLSGIFELLECFVETWQVLLERKRGLTLPKERNFAFAAAALRMSCASPT